MLYIGDRTSSLYHITSTSSSWLFDLLGTDMSHGRMAVSPLWYITLLLTREAVPKMNRKYDVSTITSLHPIMK